MAALSLLLAATTGAGSAEVAGTVVLHHHGRSEAPKTSEDALRKLGVELLKSASFNTGARPDILKQSLPAVHDRYRRVVAGDHMIIIYDRPVKVRTAGGEVSVFEIVIGLARPDYADALFTIDEHGRVVAHEKYSGRTAVELRKAASLPAP
jgi:hypothetical protein